MKIETLKELGAVIDLCRRKGVTSIELDGIKMHINDYETPSKLKTEEAKEETTHGLSEEDLLMWSAGGLANG